MAPTAADVARRPEPASSAEAEAQALLDDLRRRGFDLRRPVFVAHLIELQGARDVAYLLWRRASDEGRRSSLYADDTGWVVRLGRLVRPRKDTLERAAQEAREIAQTYGGSLRGVTVEDLTVDDTWSRLAAAAQGRDTPGADGSTPRVVALRRSA